MATENLTINIRENGSRSVQRSIDEIGNAADRATRGLYLFQRAIYTLGAAGALAGITGMLDGLTQMENRLKLTTNSTMELERVQTQLFRVAERSRTSFTATAEVYNRMALSAKQLGLETRDLLAVTETLNKASILSGAKTQEANAALIQLGQGIASNRLGGDELRSILEQLPYVADLIARSLGVTRGELRKLGSEGKLTAEVVINALREAKDEVDKLFLNTSPTISQALNVALNSVLEQLDKFDDRTGTSEALANAILKIADSMSALVPIAITLSGLLLGMLGQSLINAFLSAAAANTVFIRSVAAGNTVLLGTVAAQRAAAAQAVITTTANANAAASELNRAQATNSAIAAMVAKRTAELASVQATMATAAANNTATVSYVQLIQAKANLTAAQNALTASNARVTVSQAAATAAMNAQSVAVANAMRMNYGFVASVQAKLMSLRLVAATVYGVTAAFRSLWAVMLANPFTILLLAGASLYAYLSSLKTNIEIVNESITKTTETIRILKSTADSMGQLDLSKAASEGLSLIQVQLDLEEATLASGRAYAEVNNELNKLSRNNWVGMSQVMRDNMSQLSSEFRSGQISAGELVSRLDNLSRSASAADSQFIRLVRSLVEKAIAASEAEQNVHQLERVVAILSGSLPALAGNLDMAASSALNLASAADVASSSISQMLALVPAFAAEQRRVGQITKAGKILREGQAAITKGLADGTYSIDAAGQAWSKLGDEYNRVIGELDGTAEATRRATKAQEDYARRGELASLTGKDRALRQATLDYEAHIGTLKEAKATTEQLAQAEAAYQQIVGGIERDFAKKGGGGGKGKKGGGRSKEETKDQRDFIAELYQEADALRMTSREREIATGILRIEKDLKRDLTAAEAAQAAEALKNVQISREMGSILDGLRGPQENLQLRLAAINELFKTGAIDAKEYSAALTDVAASTDNLHNSFMGGIQNGIARVANQTKDFGKNISDWVVGSFNSATEAVVTFAKTGQVNIRQFFQDIFANLLRIATNQLFARLLGGFMGGAGGGGGAGGIFGAMLGGGKLPGFAAGGSIPPSGIGQTDSQLVAFKKRPDERVDILTPAQQKAQAAAMAGGSSGSSSPTVNTSVPITIINEDDPDRAIAAMESEAGSRVIINTIRRNPQVIKRLLS